MRWVVMLGLVASCDKVFGLDEVVMSNPAPDALVVVDAKSTDPISTVGCKSGERAAFETATEIAACSGAWTSPGVETAGLCADGWHICKDSADAAVHGVSAGCDTVPSGMFFATLQGSSKNDVCDGNGDDDIFGCGVDIGSVLGSCGNLNRAMGTFSGPPGEWSFTDGAHELSTATKGPGNGGVLCCLDDPAMN